MSNDGEKTPVTADAFFLMVFRLAVPALLGAILTYAMTISTAQTRQGEQLAAMNGQIGILASQSGDYVARLGKLEARVEDIGKNQSANMSRIMVLESARHYK
jgi:hypothetical protein